MKVLNFVILALILAFLSVWLFNHINAWAGIGLFAYGVYFSIYKFSSYLKGKKNEIK